MWAPRKVCNNQWVKIPRIQRLATSMEADGAFEEVTNQMKPSRAMYQAVMEMNVLSPVMINVMKVDALHLSGRQHHYSRNWQVDGDFIGVAGNSMIQDGYYINLGDPFISFEIKCFKSTCKQIRKDEDAWTNKWKSELLIVLGAWESQAHGEAAAEMKLEKIRLALS